MPRLIHTLVIHRPADMVAPETRPKMQCRLSSWHQAETRAVEVPYTSYQTLPSDHASIQTIHADPDGVRSTRSAQRSTSAPHKTVGGMEIRMIPSAARSAKPDAGRCDQLIDRVRHGSDQ